MTFSFLWPFTRFPLASMKWPELLQSTNSGWVTLHLDLYFFCLGEIPSQATSSTQSGHHQKMTKGLRGASFCLDESHCYSRRARHRAGTASLPYHLTFPLLPSGVQASLVHCTIPCKTITLLLSPFALAIPVAGISWKGGKPRVAHGYARRRSELQKPTLEITKRRTSPLYSVPIPR